QQSARRIRDQLVRVGIDDVAGYVTGIEGLPQATPKTIDPAGLADLGSALLLDVRAKGEYDAGSIPGATQLHGGRVLWHLDQLPAEGTIVAYCQSGARSSIAASGLRRAGYDVVELLGAYPGWRSHRDAQDAATVAQ